MGLKDDIFTALITNIQPDNPGENFDLSDKAVDKVDTLAQNLTDAIIKFIQAQTFTVTKLNATQLGTTTLAGMAAGVPPGNPLPIPPLVIPKITVKVDENNQAVDNQLSGAESLTSEVKLKRAVEV